MKIYEKIVAGKFDIPDDIDINAKILIEQLLNTNPEARLGSLQGAIEIKGMNWFKGVDFQKAYRKEVTPPWVPRFSSSIDANAFGFFNENPEFFEPAGYSVNQFFNEF